MYYDWFADFFLNWLLYALTINYPTYPTIKLILRLFIDVCIPPVLIRRTGTLFKGPNYIEFNIHVHKFANLAKQSIHLITSRCNVMYMQIGFVIEGIVADRQTTDTT